MVFLVSFAAGLWFGLGLIVSGMANPAKVLGFLDLAGDWDPSLAFVMAGAIAVGGCGFAVARRRGLALLGQPIRLPKAAPIDARLIGGSALFGLGWGLAGICPGPAVVLLGAGFSKGLVFCLAMIGGMAAFEAVARRRDTVQTAAAAAPGLLNQDAG
jgi:uncharacterized membrane protein YedE/YeeE